MLNSRATSDGMQTWLDVYSGWRIVLRYARAAGDAERTSAAEAKIAECEAELQRAETHSTVAGSVV